MTETIQGIFEFLTVFQKEMNDINFYVSKFGKGSNSSAKKIYDNAAVTFSNIGELMTLLQSELTT